MKMLLKGMLYALALLTSASGFAQDTIAGVWAGKLQVAPGNAITVQFTLSQEAGAWKAVVNSPDSGAIKNVKATAVSFDGKKLDIKVDALSGSYSGTLANGTVTGEWAQPGSKLPMNLTPFKASVLSAADITRLMGPWHGKLQGPNGMSQEMALVFEKNPTGELAGSIGVVGGPARTPVSDISVEKNELFFRVGGGVAEYRASITATGFNGQVKQGTQSMELNMVKGAAMEEKINLALSATDYDKLAGEWSGTLSPPGAPTSLTLIMSFEKDATGAIAGFMRSPQQGNVKLKITSATLTGKTLSVATTIPPAKFTGELDGKTVTGTWSQGPVELPLVFTKQ